MSTTYNQKKRHPEPPLTFASRAQGSRAATRLMSDGGLHSLRRPSSGRGPRGAAPTISPAELAHLLEFIDHTSNHPEADRCKMLFGVHAGLRVGEIAELRVSDVTDASGATADRVTVRAGTTKTGRGRVVPLTFELRGAINKFRDAHPDQDRFAIAGRSKNSTKPQSAKTLCGYVTDIYRRAGLKRCSTHTGRRTFATMLAREHGKAGRSLRDVQKLLGHARLDTTQRYIDCVEDVTPLIAIISSKLGGC